MIFPYINGESIVTFEIKSEVGIWIPFWAYVDSGARYSVFHPDHAKILGVNIYKGRKIPLTVGNGMNIDTYIHKLPVKFAEKEFTAEISFSPSLGTGTNILGMKSFFDNFQICFNNNKQQIEINPF